MLLCPEMIYSWLGKMNFVLRQLTRTNADREAILIENNDDFQFLKRCFYYGPKPELFYEALFQNMANLTIVTCVLQSPPKLISGFLNFLGQYIQAYKPPSNNLQFLINMYRKEFRADFIGLINKMNPELCAHLLARTSNNELSGTFKT